MKWYINYLNNEKNNNKSKLILIVYDFFREHLKKSVKENFKEHNYDLTVILSGLINIY